MRKLIFVGLVAVLALTAVPAMAAPIFLAPKDGSVAINSPLNDDLYAAGASINIEKPIQGDLIACGGTVEINASVSGDVLVAGDTVIIRGNVGDDVRVTGGHVNIYGTVGDDLLVAGGTVTIGSTAVIRGDLVAGASNLVLDGKVLGNLRVGAGTAAIKGSIADSADIHVSKLTFGDNARIGGTLRYWAAAEGADFAQHASRVEYHKVLVKHWAKLGVIGAFTGIALTVMFWKWIGLLLLGAILILLLPKYMPKVAEGIKKNYWASLWCGLLTAVLTPLLAFGLMVTIVGLPLGLLLLLVYVLMLIMGIIAGSYHLGRALVRSDKTIWAQLGSLLVGTIIFGLLAFLPIIGWLAGLWIILVGLGGMLTEQWKLAKQYR